MEYDSHESRSLGEHIVDRKTWQRIYESVNTLVDAHSTPFMLEDSFLVDTVSDEDYPNQQIGECYETGTISTGRVRIAVLDAAKHDLLVAADEENLTAIIDFAKENDKARFAGRLRMYGYANGVAEIDADIAGRILTTDSDTGFDFSAFASEIGLSRIWSQVCDNPGNSQDSRFAGRIDAQTSFNLAYALSQRAKPKP